MRKLYSTSKKHIFYNLKTLLFILLFASFQQGNAQAAAYYGFSQTTETYSELDNPTIIATTSGTTGNSVLDDVNTSNVALPFNFTFAGNNYAAVNVNSNGYVSFGTTGTATSSPINSNNNSSSSGVISVFGADLKGFYNVTDVDNSTISTQEFGTAPNRTFAIQWQNFRLYANTDLAYMKVNFQLHLHEDGTIQFIYGNSSFVAPSSGVNAGNVQAGLRGLTNADFTTRYAQGNTTNNWTSNTAGSDNLSGIATNVTNSLPTEGLTFTWTLPAECEAPIAQPTALNLTNTGIIINGSFTAANPSVDRYLILRNIEGETPNTPVDGTTYTVGQNATLNSYVVYYGGATSFENNYLNAGIRGNNTYEYLIYSVNSNCTGGPLYLLEEPLSGTITNCPISLNGITNSNITTDTFQLNWPIGENGNALELSRIIEVATDTNFTNMVEGSPFSLQASDLSIVIGGLEANTRYFYRGKNVTSLCSSDYSSVASLYTACVAVSDFNENFDTIATVNSSLQLPNCWSRITVGVTSSVPTVNITPTYHNSAPNGVTFYGNGADMTNLNNKAILVSPQLNNIGNGTHRLRFNAKMSSNGGTYDLQVVALSSNTANADIELIGTITASQLSATYQEFSVNFNEYSGTANYVGIRRINGSSFSYLCVDDITWEAIPSCPELQTVVASDSTVSGATISWEDPFQTPEDGYEYFISTTNTAPSESETFETTFDTYAVISGLANGTYYAFVRRVCSQDDKSPWRQTSFSTVPTASAPWLEVFGNSTPTGWTTTGWSLGTSAAYPGNTGMNLHKNLYGTGSYSSGTFTTIAVGPLNTDNYELSFDYRQGDYYSPYAPMETWGNFTVEVSSDFGETWNQIGIVNNNEDNNQNIGTQLQYVKKVYSLADYQGEYVKIRISATRTAGDFYLSFDNFEIKAPIVEIEGITVATQNDIPTEITTANGTLQLVATVYPSEANQNVIWSVISGDEFASVDANGLVTAIANGTATIRATSTEDDTMLDEIEVTINISEETGYCIPDFFYPAAAAGIQLNQISLAGETIAWNVNPVAYNEEGYADYTNSQSVDLISGNSYDLNFHTDWQDPQYINVRAWIDYNQNYQFDDNEEIGYVINGVDANGEGVFNFTIPENTAEGIYRLRAILQFPNSTPNNLTPCGTINSYGIAIDYNLQVINGGDVFCNNTEPGENVGDTGCVSFIYDGQTVSYTTVRAADGNIWLQQNLGSTVVAETMSHEDSYGDLFQWGRWADGHQKRTSETTTTVPNPNNPSGITSGLSSFITSSPGWWSSNVSTDEWNATDVASATETNGCDPCKALGEGWKLPSQDDWTILVDAEDFNNPAGAFESTLKLPANGYRSSSNGSFTFVGQRGYYWSSTTSTTGAKYLYVGTTLANPAAGAMRGQGAAIRCVKLSEDLSIGDFEKNNVRLYPNPTTGFVTIQSELAIENVMIYNQLGQLITTQKSSTIDLSNVPSGIYIVQIQAENNSTTTQKIIKK